MAEMERKLTENIQASRRTLETELAMANQEMVLAQKMLEMKKDYLMDFNRKRAEYDRRKRDYELQLRGHETLRERQLTQKLERLENRPAKITLDLHNVSLADTMDYALRLGGLAYRLRANTVVIGTPSELDGFRRE